MVYFVFNFPPDSPLNVCDRHFSEWRKLLRWSGYKTDKCVSRYAVEMTPEQRIYYHYFSPFLSSFFNLNVFKNVLIIIYSSLKKESYRKTEAP